MLLIVEANATPFFANSIVVYKNVARNIIDVSWGVGGEKDFCECYNVELT